MHRLLLICAIVSFLSVTYDSIANPEDCETPIPWGCPAPGFRLPSLTLPEGTVGDSLGLSDFEGKVRMLSFFGYACHVCQSQRPAIQSINQMFDEDDDFQLLSIDVWNGPPFLVRDFYATCSTATCEVISPFLLYGGTNDVNEDYCLPAPLSDRGVVIVDKCGIVRLSLVYIDFDQPEYQQAVIDTIAKYIAPVEAPANLLITPVTGGVQLSWIGAGPCVGGYDLFSSSDPDFDDEMYLGRFTGTEATVSGLYEREYFRVRTVFPGAAEMNAPPVDERE